MPLSVVCPVAGRRPAERARGMISSQTHTSRSGLPPFPLPACSQNENRTTPARPSPMKRGRRRAERSCPPFAMLMVSSLAGLAVCAAASPTAPAAAAFMASPGVRQSRQRGGSVGTIQAVQSRQGASRDDRRVAVHDESWYLGDGGFAARHLEDEGRMAAKQVGGGGYYETFDDAPTCSAFVMHITCGAAVVDWTGHDRHL